MTADELAWQANALCAQTDPEAFFPGKGESNTEAKRVCGDCEVRSECLLYALANEEHWGIWGGLSEYERRQMRKGTYKPKERIIRHGTRTMYSKGCTDETACPGSPDGRTCSQAARESRERIAARRQARRAAA